MSFTLEDLGVAYRKAKVDLYYSTNSSIFAIADYEENLCDRLSNLLELLNGDDETWVKKPKFLGSWTLTTKSVSWPDRKKELMSEVVYGGVEWNRREAVAIAGEC
ncbi:hypothetical protein, partial [Burkholderia ubonensis]|uniref:hypothetical protein n=1 Tax=Burkholderia ubonensis TaxID=101571 RepID=UPI000AEDC669